MNEIVTRQQQLSSASQERSALTTELAKMLGLVAPVTMSADQQTLWLASAVEALGDMRAEEVAAVSVDIRRTVTRPSQIVPEVAKLVAELRERRAKATRKPLPELPPPPPSPPFSQEEIDRMAPDLVKMGLKCGALIRDVDGRLKAA